MPPPVKGYISDQEASYIGLLLQNMDPRGKENALERLCSYYRNGFRLRNPHSVQQTLNGLLYSLDASVRRWTLNAIALIGIKRDNLQATLEAIERDRGNEDILGAGIAALVALTQPDDVVGLLGGIGIALEGAALLAAAQQTTSYNSKLAAKRININCASESELRLASVLVGLNKAPEHLFDLSHDNKTIIGALNSHHDPIVAQYSVWSICENPRFSVLDLGVKLTDIERLPDNVRGYVLRLITANAEIAEKNREYLTVGAQDPSEKARQGLATGMLNTYFSGLEQITVDWLGMENSQVIKDNLLDHMATHADRCRTYHDAVVEAYKSSGAGSLIRHRLEAAAAKTSAYAELKRISIRSETFSLFGETEPMGARIVNQFNAQNMNIGAVTGDNANIKSAVGAIQNNSNGAQEALSILEKILSKSSLTNNEISHGKNLIAEAQKNPSKGTLDKVVSWMKKAKDGTGYALSASQDFQELCDKLVEISSNILS
ncbi:hypothetical protein [Niveispirillum sp. KHB5.9]|uniref:hypothetical protein n=1 Tax=Niveispirillum sp. KHB5.9 TaxID=3400269 RepID=UPI003A8808A3